MNDPIRWVNVADVKSRSYRCGHCGESISSGKAYTGLVNSNTSLPCYTYVCHNCTRPTFIDRTGAQYPGALFGDSVKDVSDPSVANIYDEARRAYSASAFTGAVLCCRKLLMHVGVSKGAPAGGNFISYVEYLRDKHYVPPDAAGWVDHIRKKGNEANHEITMATPEEAEELISFCEMLMKVIYEFPAAVRKKSKPTS